MSAIEPLPENEEYDTDGPFKTAFNECGRGERGQAGAMQVVGLVVALTVGAIVAAFLLPIGIEELTNASLGADASEGAEALWGILDVIIVLAVFLFFIAVAMRATKKV